MKRMAYIIAVIFIIFVAAIIIRSVSQQKNLAVKEVTIHGATFNAEIADTDASRMLGLSFRKSLGENDGMLFIFQTPAAYTFWMKGMNFPLDFVWISKGTVVQTTENVPIPTSTLDFATYTPAGQVDQVLEINAGVVAKTGIQAGDTVVVK